MILDGPRVECSGCGLLLGRAETEAQLEAVTTATEGHWSICSPGHDARFAPRLPNAEQVEERAWEGVTYRVGDQVAYDVTVYGLPQPKDTRTVRHEGTIAEVWFEPWQDGELVYLEVGSSDGEPERAWLHRDHVGPVGTLGAAPEGALL